MLDAVGEGENDELMLKDIGIRRNCVQVATMVARAMSTSRMNLSAHRLRRCCVYLVDKKLERNIFKFGY